ncbi:MAG: hypothetical protein KC591_06215, partial [Gemmatimonadetes bacterium]|nr:hypothetical protein [Gemmatimonadota bacterium]
MNSGWTPPDPRLRILVGVLVLLLVAIGVRTCVGPGPREGRRINEAETLLRDGQSEAARVELQALLEDHPTEAASWLRAGRALRGAGRAEESVLYLT